MSALITTGLLTPCGTIGDTTTPNIVDAAGNLKTSAQFIPNKVIDYAGNLGQLIATGPWEISVGTAETVGQDQGSISTNYNIAATPVTSMFASAGCTGYVDGVLSGIGTLQILGGTQTIGGVPYAGSGLLVFRGANTHTGVINMAAGTNLQLGADCTNAQTKAGGGLTIGAGATCTQYTSYTTTLLLCTGLNNSGTYNVTGCGVCGEGGLGRATTVANNGVINIDKAYWGHQSTFSGTGTINVKDGGSLQLSTTTIGATQTANINGCGWCNAAGVQVGAINATATGVSYAMKINVQTAACIKTNSNVNATFSGVLSGSAPLTVGTLGAPVTGTTHFSNTANTYSGTITVDGTNLAHSYGNALQYAKIVLANGGRIGTGSSTNAVIGSLASSDPTTYWSNGDFTVNTIKDNGVTTYAGRILWNGGSNTSNIYLNGPATNELTMTGTGNTATMLPRNGARLILQGATFTGTQGQVRASTGATVSAGTSVTASVSNLYIDGTSKLEVRAAGAGASLMTVTAGFVPSAGWKVDAVDALSPGTYPIIKYSGTATTVLPTLGINNTGGTVTFAYNNAVNPKVLNMIVTA